MCVCVCVIYTSGGDRFHYGFSVLISLIGQKSNNITANWWVSMLYFPYNHHSVYIFLNIFLIYTTVLLNVFLVMQWSCLEL